MAGQNLETVRSPPLHYSYQCSYFPIHELIGCILGALLHSCHAVSRVSGRGLTAQPRSEHPPAARRLVHPEAHAHCHKRSISRSTHVGIQKSESRGWISVGTRDNHRERRASALQREGPGRGRGRDGHPTRRHQIPASCPPAHGINPHVLPRLAASTSPKRAKESVTRGPPPSSHSLLLILPQIELE